MDVIVSSKNGQIRGLKKTSRLGDEYFSFQGVPFAKPPVGELRFKAPVPIEPWDGVLDATEQKAVSHYLMTHFKGQTPSEDCLYLNVYAKNVSQGRVRFDYLAHVLNEFFFQLNGNKKPVLVFIHGGAFNSGSSTTQLLGPDWLMQKEVILVTLNYRLNAFGLLGFKDPNLKVPGNAFLKDQRLALRWVKENISDFGGDPENVTLFGHSAGAASVHHLLLAPSCEGLFRRAVVMSGAVFCIWGTMQFLNMGERLALNTGWDGEGGERGAYEHLMSLDAATLTSASEGSKLLTGEDYAKDVFYPFGPMVEPYEDEDSICTASPLELAKNSWSQNLDVIFWLASNEMLLDVERAVKEALQNGISDNMLVLHRAKKHMDEAQVEEATKKVKALYGDFKDFGPDNVQPFIDVSLSSQ